MDTVLIGYSLTEQGVRETFKINFSVCDLTS